MHTHHERSLIGALILTSVVFVFEAVGGIITHSLGLISDAAHMLTDVTALTIAFMAIRIGRRKAADKLRSFGYYRFEILAAAFNTLMLFLIAIFIFYEAYKRLHAPASLHTTGMLIVATIGCLANAGSLWLLSPGKSASLNMKGAYLEVFSDMLGSLGVMVAAIIIKLTGWAGVDSIIAIMIAVWILPRAWALLKESINVLLEGTPSHLNLDDITQAMSRIEGVKDIHELHVWAISTDKICLTAHIVLNEKFDCDEVLRKLREMLAATYKIHHTTLQHEKTKCLDEETSCHFGPSS